MNDELRRLYAENAAEAARVARAIGPEQLSGRTPCTEYDVRALVNHWVLYASHGAEHRARRDQLSDDLTARDFAAEPDWAENYAAELDRAVAAWDAPAAWEGELDIGGGWMASPDDYVVMLLGELVLHGWDVARATGQEYRASPATVETVLRFVEQNGEMFRQYKAFGESVETAPDAGAFERALALSGRDPRWS